MYFACLVFVKVVNVLLNQTVDNMKNNHVLFSQLTMPRECLVGREICILVFASTILMPP